MKVIDLYYLFGLFCATFLPYCGQRLNSSPIRLFYDYGTCLLP